MPWLNTRKRKSDWVELLPVRPAEDHKKLGRQLKGRDVMVDRAKSIPTAGLRSPIFEALIGRYLKQRVPLGRVVLTIAVVAVSIALAVLTS
jgi:hypothetical protein